MTREAATTTSHTIDGEPDCTTVVIPHRLIDLIVRLRLPGVEAMLLLDLVAR